MGLDGFACLLPAAYWLHKIVFLNDHLFVRSIAIFGSLAVLGFGELNQGRQFRANIIITPTVATVLLLLARSDQQDGMGLMNDFALLSHPATVIKVAIGMAILATLLCETLLSLVQRGIKKADIFIIRTAVMGFLVAQMGWMSHRMERQSVRNHRNATQLGCITTTQSDNQTLRSNNASASTLYADIELGTKAGNRFKASPRDG